MRLMEMRNSPDEPFLFMAWLDPVSGASTVIPLPDEWYLNWEVDPQYLPTQWAGSTRRVWGYDPINQFAWFKLYDECGGQDDSCEYVFFHFSMCVIFLSVVHRRTAHLPLICDSPVRRIIVVISFLV
jgi:hypothetical protein